MSERTWPNWNVWYFSCLPDRRPYFHVWKDVAQLKRPLSAGGLPSRWRDFHVWKDVAQLKPFRRQGNFIHIGKAFPCLKGRGPIETAVTYPAFSLESWFPCLKGRGPIETVIRTVFAEFVFDHFHVWKDVAQLKPFPGLGVMLTIRLHISMSERTWPNWNHRSLIAYFKFFGILFPCLKGRGPIETLCQRYPANMSNISMSERTWPNWNSGE